MDYQMRDRIHQQQNQSIDTEVIWIQKHPESYRYDHDRLFQSIF